MQDSKKKANSTEEVKAIQIEVEIANNQSAPKVKYTMTKGLNAIDLMVMMGAMVGVIYSVIIAGTKHAEKKRRRAKLIETIQRYMTSADKGGLTEYPKTDENGGGPLKKV